VTTSEPDGDVARGSAHPSDGHTGGPPPSGGRAGPPPSFDPELEATIRELGGDLTSARPLSLDDIPDLRREQADMAPPSDEQLEDDGAFVVDEREVPGPADAPEVRLLICRPRDATGPVPAVYYLHGGGMVSGSHRTGVEALLAWAQELRLAVVSVDYRLAPEAPHPAPVDDSYAGLSWLSAHADDVGIDPQRVVIVGKSAGAGIAAAVALRARDEGGPALAGQLLMGPMLDDRNDTPSAHQLEGVGVWDRRSNATGWRALLGDAAGGPDVSPYAAPARADDLSGLPPAFIDVGSSETFRDEAVAYASRIWLAGGHAELHVWPGGFHGFAGSVPAAPLSRDARAARLRWLRRLLGR
jgi:acetyl esterase/lipase